MTFRGGDSQVLFSDTVVKVNKRTKTQERILLMTENHLYNIDKANNYKVKRKIPLREIGSIILSTFADNFFVIQVPSEYDYLLVSSRKTEIVLRLLASYEMLTKEPLDIQFLNRYETKPHRCLSFTFEGLSFDYAAEVGYIREVEFVLSPGQSFRGFFLAS